MITPGHVDKAAQTADQVFVIQRQFAQVRNAKKAAVLIKECDLDIETVSREFVEIEDIIINEAMCFYMPQFGVSFKTGTYIEQNVLRLADYLIDYGP